MTMNKKILIGDDHAMIRKGLRTILTFNLGYTDIKEAVSCHEILKELKQDVYTHLILDIVLQDGYIMEILPYITRLYPNSRILIFSMQPEEVYRKVLLQYGIHHYISKNLLEGETISHFGRFLNNEHSIQENVSKDIPNNPFSSLSARELEVFHYLIEGIGTHEIGARLSIKGNTASTIKTRILEKTNCKNVKELAELATLYNIT